MIVALPGIFSYPFYTTDHSNAVVLVLFGLYGLGAALCGEYFSCLFLFAALLLNFLDPV